MNRCLDSTTAYTTGDMNTLEAIILGIVQGLTEFLPVSSTGHLILAREVLGLDAEFGLAVDAMLHLATAGAVLIYFRHDILRLVRSTVALMRGREVERAQKMLIGALVLGTIPAVVLGLLLEDSIETTFRSAELVAWVLIAGSGLFLMAEYVSKRYESVREISVKRGVAIGFFQALALLPGMSRSGATISGGLLLGLSREEAARFAFLLSFPVILGAGGLKFAELGASGVLAAEWLPILLGALAAFLSGLAAIHYLLKFLKNHTLMVFVVYRLVLACVVLLLV